MTGLMDSGSTGRIFLRSGPTSRQAATRRIMMASVLVGSASCVDQRDQIIFQGSSMGEDCSVQGFDNSWPAPIAEGDGVLSMSKSMETYDGQPFPMSELAIASCETGRSVGMWSDDSAAAGDAISRLRTMPVIYEDWAAELAKLAAPEKFGSLTAMKAEQLQCACERHYGIEVPL